MLRRDLFDARFQLISQDEIDEQSASGAKGKEREEFNVDEATDLVKGVYEGGLKTWECSLDLVDYLDTIGCGLTGDEEMVRGKSVLEVSFEVSTYLDPILMVTLLGWMWYKFTHVCFTS